ncbi:hypothetical protein JDT53_12555 [Escherichia coli]|nr:hypothetical protein [Escherichia coli]EJS6324265.1 hypothetical protein [Escherichia coli]EKM0761540.1 hypothetical protein [Escherichia coli]EKQ6353130.1 hypothetical protein [Escherichia coli]ELI4584677.1 hypothetical protein [Escherichia coli]
MSTFTKDQLISRINQVTAINKYRLSRDPDADGLAMDNELFAIALASIEAEPVAWAHRLINKHNGVVHPWVYGSAEASPSEGDIFNIEVMPLYTTPPAPVVQGKAEPVSQPYKLPDGWVAVPVEPTAEMISSGIAAHYERSQLQIHDRPAPGPMECAYVAMLAAAPQQEAE